MKVPNPDMLSKLLTRPEGMRLASVPLYNARWASTGGLEKLSNRSPPEELRRTNWAKPQFPVQKLTALLDHDNLEMRQEFRKFLSDPAMTPR